MDEKLGKAKDEYRQYRYLQHATKGELTQRLDDIFVNFVYFAPEVNPWCVLLLSAILLLR